MFNSQLTAFVCAADSGSFSKAAETLYISSTAVMKQINALEKHLDLKLLERSSRGISLTPAGNVIYKYAQRIFDESETAICEARLVASEAETTFCVGTSILNPCKPFMDLWYQINEQFPGYKLHIVPFEDNHEGILGEIASLGTKFDFLIGACDSRQWLDRCNFLQLGTYRHCVAVPRQTVLARAPSGAEAATDHLGSVRGDADDGSERRFAHGGPGACRDRTASAHSDRGHPAVL